MKKPLVIALVLAILAGTGFTLIHWYEYVFAKDVKGQLMKAERVSPLTSIISNGQPVPAAELFSYAVAIKDSQGEIHTASTEDRQWAAATPGLCVEAKFFPYPPWQLDKSGTFHNARLIRLYDCPKS